MNRTLGFAKVWILSYSVFLFLFLIPVLSWYFLSFTYLSFTYLGFSSLFFFCFLYKIWKQAHGFRPIFSSKEIKLRFLLCTILAASHKHFYSVFYCIFVIQKFVIRNILIIVISFIHDFFTMCKIFGVVLDSLFQSNYNLVSLWSENIFYFKLFKCIGTFPGPVNSLSWQTYCKQLKRMCILLLLNIMFYTYQLDQGDW